jgi:hypothetical protein
VLQPGGDRDLPLKPLGTERRRELGPQHLERHPAAVLAVLGEVDHGHPAPSQLPLEVIAVRHGGQEAFVQVRVHAPPLVKPPDLVVRRRASPAMTEGSNAVADASATGQASAPPCSSEGWKECAAKPGEGQGEDDGARSGPTMLSSLAAGREEGDMILVMPPSLRSG